MEPSYLTTYNLLIFNTLDSTNEEAKRLVRYGLPGNFVIIADNQVAGRGQQNKSWLSATGNLHMTLLIEMNKKLADNLNLVFLTANVLADTIESLNTSAKVKLKWPNDILINNKKVAGILIETIKINNKPYILIGIGVNIKYAPDNVSFAASTLSNEIDYKEDSYSIFHEFMLNFDHEFKIWQEKENFSDIRQKWISRAYRLNKAITVGDGKSRISGLFKNIEIASNLTRSKTILQQLIISNLDIY